MPKAADPIKAAGTRMVSLKNLMASSSWPLTSGLSGLNQSCWLCAPPSRERTWRRTRRSSKAFRGRRAFCRARSTAFSSSSCISFCLLSASSFSLASFSRCLSSSSFALRCCSSSSSFWLSLCALRLVSSFSSSPLRSPRSFDFTAWSLDFAASATMSKRGGKPPLASAFDSPSPTRDSATLVRRLGLGLDSGWPPRPSSARSSSSRVGRSTKRAEPTIRRRNGEWPKRPTARHRGAETAALASEEGFIAELRVTARVKLSWAHNWA
mmetsp:Transcript_88003/g.244261  ORF Transcript_88003/g.244261 Transcript_88003/m.244261 type:complete len:267 (+) Transcript_88003:706-1506(+)